MMKKYAKFIVAALAAALTVTATLVQDGSLSTADVVTIISAAFGAVAVFFVPNATQ